MCVKSLVDKSAFEAITDECLHLQNLCNTLEHILLHRMQRELGGVATTTTSLLLSLLQLGGLYLALMLPHTGTPYSSMPHLSLLLP